MSDSTVIEFCLTREQSVVISLVIYERHLVEETLAEALYAARLDWARPTYAFPTVVRKFAKFYTTELKLTHQRLQPDRTAFVVDFTSALVSNRDEGKAYTLPRFLKEHDVP
jgi:hypothetical protein